MIQQVLAEGAWGKWFQSPLPEERKERTSLEALVIQASRASVFLNEGMVGSLSGVE